jgi:hypothetical protein
MTGQRAAPGADAVRRAVPVVDLGLAACAAYGRQDLGRRLAEVRRRLDDPGVHLVVVGEFKKGKSSLVNALVGAGVCPVDDDILTAVPTYVRYGPRREASALFTGAPSRREPIPPEDLRRHLVADEPGQGAPHRRPDGVEIRLPHTLLAGGLVIVDTPGTGGLGSPQAAANLAAISVAGAVLFVTDASQELTRTEVDFVRRARCLGGTVICALTKVDAFPSWRAVRDLDERHLAEIDAAIPLLPVSCPLRTLAIRRDDEELDVESGFPALVGTVSGRVAADGVRRLAAEAAGEVIAVTHQIESRFEAERAALADPAAGAGVVDSLTATGQRARHCLATWQQTLADGVVDLAAEVDHDLRARFRAVVVEAEAAIDGADPADTWQQVETWLAARLSHEVLESHTVLRRRAEDLSELVSRHFHAASDAVLDDLGLRPPPDVGGVRVSPTVALERQGVVLQAWSMLRQSYGGILMFTVLPGILLPAAVAASLPAAFPAAAVAAGLVMGHKSLTEEKKRHLRSRREQAKSAVRRYCDEVSFVVSKDSRDTVRRIQRQLRDHYAGRAEELHRSGAEALRAARAAAGQDEARRRARLDDITAELARLAELRARARAVRG